MSKDIDAVKHLIDRYIRSKVLDGSSFVRELLGILHISRNPDKLMNYVVEKTLIPLQRVDFDAYIRLFYSIFDSEAFTYISKTSLFKIIDSNGINNSIDIDNPIVFFFYYYYSGKMLYVVPNFESSFINPQDSYKFSNKQINEFVLENIIDKGLSKRIPKNYYYQLISILLLSDWNLYDKYSQDIFEKYPEFKEFFETHISASDINALINSGSFSFIKERLSEKKAKIRDKDITKALDLLYQSKISLYPIRDEVSNLFKEGSLKDADYFPKYECSYMDGRNIRIIWDIVTNKLKGNYIPSIREAVYIAFYEPNLFTIKEYEDNFLKKSDLSMENIVAHLNILTYILSNRTPIFENALVNLIVERFIKQGNGLIVLDELIHDKDYLPIIKNFYIHNKAFRKYCVCKNFRIPLQDAKER